MTYFLFGTLWSVLFWVVYITLSFFATATVLKVIAPTIFSSITGIQLPKDHYDEVGSVAFGYKVDCVLCTIIVFVAWPLFSVALLLYYTFISLVAPGFTYLLIKAAELIPTITFEKQEKKSGKH